MTGFVISDPHTGGGPEQRRYTSLGDTNIVRILTITNGYPPHYYGGYELTCFDVMERFRVAGHEVTVLTSTARVPGVIQSDPSYVHRTLTPYWDWEKNRKKRPFWPLGVTAVDRRNQKILRELIQAERPDVISVWHMMGLPMSLLTVIEQAAVPVVLTVGNDWMIQAPDYDPWSRLARRWPYPRPISFAGVPLRLPALHHMTVNFVSESVKRRALGSSRWPVDPGSPVIHPGIETTDFPGGSALPRQWSWRVLFVGRIDPVKGVSTLLRAMAQLPPDATLRIVGGGAGRFLRETKTLVSELGLSGRVEFRHRARAELHEEYLWADVVAFPSEWDEPFGLVPLEAMAMGVPVVATATGGASEFLEHESNCIVFPKGDVGELAAALRRLAQGGELRHLLVRNGARTAQQFTADRYAAELLAIHVEAGR